MSWTDTRAYGPHWLRLSAFVVRSDAFFVIGSLHSRRFERGNMGVPWGVAAAAKSTDAPYSSPMFTSVQTRPWNPLSTDCWRKKQKCVFFVVHNVVKKEWKWRTTRFLFKKDQRAITKGYWSVKNSFLERVRSPIGTAGEWCAPVRTIMRGKAQRRAE